MNNSTRPTFFNLALIRFPANAVASILHRISGVILSLLVVAMIYLLDRSLQGPEGFTQVTRLFNSAGMKLIGIVALWALFQHLFAGIRFLLFDIHIGVRDYRPSWSARLTVILALIATLLVAAGLWW